MWIKLNKDNYTFFKDIIKFLGHTFTNSGLGVYEDKIDVIKHL